MGALSQLIRSKASVLSEVNTAPIPGMRTGQATWRRIFHGTDKEKKPSVTQGIIPGGSYGRTIGSSDLAIKRLIEAMRTRAPGGWTDDRWEETKHFIGIAYIAIHNICTQLAQSEFAVYQKDRRHPDGKRIVTEDTPGTRENVAPYDLVKLLENPNNQDSFGKWLYRTGQQQRLTGTALTWMVPNKFGVPYEMYTVPTCIAIPLPVLNPQYPQGCYQIQPLYPYGPFSHYPSPTTSTGARIPAEWVMRFQYPHPFLRYEGYSPLTGMRAHMDALEMMDKSRHSMMRRVMHPSGVLNLEGIEGSQPLPEEEIERIKAEFENSHMGPDNFGNLYVATPGARLEFPFPHPVDMDYQSGWDQLTSFILGGFGITKPAAGMVEDSAYSTLFATLKQLHLITLQPYCNEIADGLTRYMAPYFGDDLIVEIKCGRIDDHEIVFQKINVCMMAKAITKNQVLKLLDLPITREEWGDDIAGDPSPNEKKAQEQASGQAAMMQGGGAPGGEQGGGLGGLLGGGGGPTDDTRPEPAEIGRSRPGTGSLGRGALGPRKSLTEWDRYDSEFEPYNSEPLSIEQPVVTGKTYRKRLDYLKKALPDVLGDIEETPKEDPKSMFDRVREVICNGHS